MLVEAAAVVVVEVVASVVVGVVADVKSSVVVEVPVEVTPSVVVVVVVLAARPFLLFDFFDATTSVVVASVVVVLVVRRGARVLVGGDLNAGNRSINEVIAFVWQALTKCSRFVLYINTIKATSSSMNSHWVTRFASEAPSSVAGGSKLERFRSIGKTRWITVDIEFAVLEILSML